MRNLTSGEMKETEDRVFAQRGREIDGIMKLLNLHSPSMRATLRKMSTSEIRDFGHGLSRAIDKRAKELWRDQIKPPCYVSHSEDCICGDD